ncbi:MAG: efflux RND transporter permease subunit [Phycisphaerales bacterium]|nr:MAG: efflux RND transporter permease subunit [Phycisphaerales bacterium]
MSLASFGVRKPVVANLIMLAIIGAGIIFGLNLRREFFPEVRPNEVMITAIYPGAAPEEVERALAVKIEDAVADLSDVVEVNTTVSEGVATVRVEFAPGINADVAVAEVQREVDGLQDLPEDADRIRVRKFEPNLPVIILSIFGDAPEREMKDAIRRIRDDLLTLPGMGDLLLSGVRRDEIVVEVRPEAMLEYGLSLPVIAQRVRDEMVELPAGAVRSGTSNVSVRTLGADRAASEVRQIVVAARDGQRLRLGEIAEVRDGFVDIDLRTRLNGSPSAGLTVYKVGDEDAVSMSELVKAYVAGRTGQSITLNMRERLASLARPPGSESPVSDRMAAYELGRSRVGTPLPGELALTTDLARFIVDRLELLTRNALAGGFLVFLTLLLLLNWRVSFWVALGLIVSLLGTLAAMYFANITLNLLTMFGLIVVIGILVDDAIVVSENIIARHEAGEPSHSAAVSGTNQVGWPVVATVLTTMCAFLPLSLIEGRVGDLLSVLPLVVVVALGVSLIEVLIILPSHMAHSLVKIDEQAEHPTTKFARFERAYAKKRDGLFSKVLIPVYVRSLETALRMRWLSLAIAIGLVLVSLGMVRGGHLEFTFLAAEDTETVNVEIRMPIGTPAAQTDAIVRMVEAASLAQPEVLSVFAQVGALGSIEGEGSSEATHLGQVILELAPVEQRQAQGGRESGRVIVAIRQELGELPGVRTLRFSEVQGGPDGPPISLAVVGDDPSRIMAAVASLRAGLATRPGVFDLADDAEAGQREMRFRLRPGASELGFSVRNIADQVRAAVFGLEAFTFAGDREDVDVRVMAPERVRRSIAAIENMHVFTPTGEAVPLSEVAYVEEGESYATIRRLDRRRVVTVTADVDRAVQNPEQVMASFQGQLREIGREHPGVRIVERGRQQDVQDSFRTLPLGMLVATGLIYVILAWLFGSFTQPLLVLSAVPFAIIGMVWGHVLLGFDLTMLSLIGFIALSGVVVNDSLIYMEFFNQKRREGVAPYRACVEAGRARFRAILLTTITTVLGLLPLMLETSFQARFLIPMAITIAFGLLSATAIILIVLPCLLLILGDIQWAIRVLWTGKPEPRPGMPEARAKTPAP